MYSWFSSVEPKRFGPPLFWEASLMIGSFPVGTEGSFGRLKMVWWTAASFWPVSSARCLGFSSGKFGGRKAKKVRLRNGSKDMASLNTGGCLKVSGSLCLRFIPTCCPYIGWCSCIESNVQVLVWWPAQGHISRFHPCWNSSSLLLKTAQIMQHLRDNYSLYEHFCYLLKHVFVVSLMDYWFFYGHNIFRPLWCILYALIQCYDLVESLLWYNRSRYLVLMEVWHMPLACVFQMSSRWRNWVWAYWVDWKRWWRSTGAGGKSLKPTSSCSAILPSRSGFVPRTWNITTIRKQWKVFTVIV